MIQLLCDICKQPVSGNYWRAKREVQTDVSLDIDIKEICDDCMDSLMNCARIPLVKFPSKEVEDGKEQNRISGEVHEP